MTILVLCALEDACKSANMTLVTSLCFSIERIFKHYLTICENSRDMSIAYYNQSQILSISAYIVYFLYQLTYSGHSESVHIQLKKTIRTNMIFLLCLVDFLNSRTDGEFDFYEQNSRRSPTRRSSPGLRSSANSNLAASYIEAKQEYTLLTFDLVRNVLSSSSSESLITILEIRQQKNNNFYNIEATIFSTQWVASILDNNFIKDLVKANFGESYIKINQNIFLAIQNTAEIMNSVAENLIHRRKTIARKSEDIIYDSAARIHETEDNRKHEVIAFDEERMRIAKSLWRRVWKKLRIFTGQWRHSTFYDQRDAKYQAIEFEDMKGNHIFYHKMSKFETKTRARPFLKIKLTEPSYVLEYNKLLKERRHGKQLLSINTDIFPALGVQNMYLPVEKASPVLMDNDSNGKGFSLTQLTRDIKNSLLKAFILLLNILFEYF